ncbi:isoflavone reductase homolog IRL-like isoform X2 [Miscanthus floridulus]|uniref:isoflavone reductase homolog IRL-like isoform X2 n=1 Tax=Miscanthus floridulus TaxID=154761 RepID=UPI00345A88CB
MEKSRILIIGGTGHIGKHIVTASVRLGHLTVVLTRDSSPSDPAKAQLIKSFADSGAALIKKGRPGAVVRAVSLSHQVMGSKQPLRRFAGEGFLRFSLPQTPLISEPPALGLPPLGDVSDHGSLVKAVKSADIVISAVGPHQVGEQTRIIAAIKEAGNVKNFRSRWTSYCQLGMRCTSRGNISSRSTHRRGWTPASCTRT